MFGRGHFNAGVLVDPEAEFKFDPKDKEQLAEFRNSIWYVEHRSYSCLLIILAVMSRSQAYSGKVEPRCP